MDMLKIIAAAFPRMLPEPTPDYAHEVTIRIFGWRVLDFSYTTREV